MFALFIFRYFLSHEIFRIRAVSLIKGVESGPEGLTLISDKIREGLRGVVPVNVLMGANVANEVARDELCESTVSEG